MWKLKELGSIKYLVYYIMRVEFMKKLFEIYIIEFF